MKILAIVVVLVAAGVGSDGQQRPQRPASHPSMRLYHPEYKIPIARPYSTVKRQAPLNPVVIIPSASRQRIVVKEEVQEEVKPEVGRPRVRQVRKPAAIEEEVNQEVKNKGRREEVKKVNVQASRSIGHQKNPRSYSFGYVIKDQDTFNDFEQQEKRDGDVVTGSYRVNLPDGRVQLVKYRSAPETGNVMQVSYEGEAQYPDYVPRTEAKENQGKRTPAVIASKAAKTNQVVRINEEFTKINEEVKSQQQVVKINEDVKTSSSDQGIKAVYSRPTPAPTTPRIVPLPVKYSAQYKTVPRAATRARSIQPFVPFESLPTAEKLVAGPSSAPVESLLRIISESLPNREKLTAPVRARIVEFPSAADEALPTLDADIDDDANDALELDGPLPVPAAYRNARRTGDRRTRRRQVERWW